MFLVASFILFLILSGIAYIIYQTHNKKLEKRSDLELPPVEPASLFNNAPEDSTSARAGDDSARRARLALLERARNGDQGVLTPAAATGDWNFYREVLNCLLDSESCQKDLQALVSRIVDNSELRASRKMAERLIQALRETPDRRQTSRTLHIAALSDDPGCYQAAVETALQLWRDGKLTGLSNDDLVELVERQYWVLAPEARRSGDAFALKRELAGLRRQLAAAKPNASA